MKGKNTSGWKTVQDRRNYQNKRRKKQKFKSMEYLGGKCQDCGAVPVDGIDKVVIEDNKIQLPWYAFDFDHKDWVTKKHNVSKMFMSKFETIKKELDKCELVCRNCHVIRTTKMRRENKVFKESFDTIPKKYKSPKALNSTPA